MSRGPSLAPRFGAFMPAIETDLRSTRLALACALAAYVAHAITYGWYVADDAGISLAYARNLVAGHGLVLYPGAPAVEGYSNPLWVAMLAVGAALRLDGGYGIPLLRLLGVALGAATVWMTVGLARLAYGGQRHLAWMAPALLAVWTPFVFWSGAGLENGLYAFLLTLSAYLQLREIQAPERGHWSAAALLGVALTRPEGVAFFVAFLIHRVIAWDRRRGHSIRALTVWTAIFAAGLAMFLLARYWIFGAWLPNTYYAKVWGRRIQEILQYAGNVEDPGRQYAVTFAHEWWPAFVLASVGLADFRAWRANLLLAGTIGGTVLYVLYVGGDFWPEGRFFTAMLPLAAVATQHGAVMAWQMRPALGRAIALVCIVLVAVSSYRATSQLRLRHQQDTLISLQGRLAKGQQIKGLAEKFGIKDPLYLDPDIGGPTLAGLRVLDLGGLTDIHIAKFHWYAPFLKQYVFEEQRPHFIRTHSTWTRTSQLTKFAEFHEQYAAVREYRDRNGLHGEFVRRDVLAGEAAAEAPRPAPSFRQSIADARTARAREAQRERDGWIEYYGARHKHAQLLTTFRQQEAAGTLPRERERLTRLHYALLAAGDGAAAKRVAALTGQEIREGIVLYAGNEPMLTVIDVRLFTRPPDTMSWLAVYVELRRPEVAAYALWSELHAPGQTEPLRIVTRVADALTGRAAAGTAAIEIPLNVPAGEYDIRIGASRPRDNASLCPSPAGQTCYLPFGTHTVGR